MVSSPERPTFSILVPSARRASLARTVESIVGQVEPGDELLVVFNDRRDGGNWARQQAMPRASGSHLLFCDDDDVFLPGALAAMRLFATERPRRIGIFRRVFNAPGLIQWSEPGLRRGNVQAQLLCVPNVPGKLGRWGENPKEGPPPDPPWTDVFFVQETSELLGTEPVWCDVAVGLARPERNPWRRLRYRLAPRYRLRRLLTREAATPHWDAEVWRPAR